MADRPKVGPASPEVLRAAIAQARKEAIEEAKAGLYQAKPKSEAGKKPALAAGLLSVGRRKAQLENAIDDATDDPTRKRQMRAKALRE